MEQAIIYVHAKFELAQKFVKEKQKGEIGTLIVVGGTIHVMCPRPETVQALISFFLLVAYTLFKFNLCMRVDDCILYRSMLLI